LRVLLADDHRMVAEGLKELLEPEFELIGIVEDGKRLLEEAAAQRPDVAVVDITMPRVNGLEAIPLLKRAAPGLKVVVITMHREAPGGGLRAGGARGGRRRVGAQARRRRRAHRRDPRRRRR